MKEYIKKNVTKDWIYKNDFRYNRHYSIKGDTVYTYRFPLLKYKKSKKTAVECELFMFYPDGKVLINVYNYDTRDKYAPFYNSDYGNWTKVLSVMYKKINIKLKELGIEEVGRD